MPRKRKKKTEEPKQEESFEPTETQLTKFQEKLVPMIEANETLLILERVIFFDYVNLVVQEYKNLGNVGGPPNPGCTKKQLREGLHARELRQKVEGYVEEKLVLLSGIDVEALKKEAEAEEKAEALERKLVETTNKEE